MLRWITTLGGRYFPALCITNQSATRGHGLTQHFCLLRCDLYSATCAVLRAERGSDGFRIALLDKPAILYHPQASYRLTRLQYWTDVGRMILAPFINERMRSEEGSLTGWAATLMSQYHTTHHHRKSLCELVLLPEGLSHTLLHAHNKHDLIREVGERLEIRNHV